MAMQEKVSWLAGQTVIRLCGTSPAVIVTWYALEIVKEVPRHAALAGIFVANCTVRVALIASVIISGVGVNIRSLWAAQAVFSSTLAVSAQIPTFIQFRFKFDCLIISQDLIISGIGNVPVWGCDKAFKFFGFCV